MVSSLVPALHLGSIPESHVNPSNTNDVVGDYAQAGEAHARDAVIVAIVCDRGDRYLSTGVFDAR